MAADIITDNTNKKIKLHLEILRIVAAFFVIFNHTSAFSHFMTYEPNTFSYWICLAISVVCKISVPMFFMISGALLLPKYDEKPVIIIKRVLRIAVALLVFSFLSYLQQIHFGNETFNLKRFFTILIERDWMNVFWYLYAFMGYLLTLPFMRCLAQKMEFSHYIYLICLHLIFSGIIPILLYLLYEGRHHLNSNFSVSWMFGYYPIYPLIGHFLENKLDINKLRKNHMMILWGINIISISLTCYVTYYNNKLNGYFTQNYLMCLIPINCITLYITIKKLVVNLKTTKFSGFIISMGRCTFGIYLIHGLLLREPDSSILNDILASEFFKNMSLNPMVQTSLRCLEIMLIGYLVTLILKKIPFVKKIV